MHRVDTQPFSNKKIALVLSGGFVKAAAWHLGVTLALEEMGFGLKSNNKTQSDGIPEISTFVGSSSGALINFFLVSGFSSQDLVEAFIHRNHPQLPPIGYSDIFGIRRPKKEKINPYF